MKRRTPRRNAVAAMAMMIVTFSLGMAGAVLVAHPAAASSSAPASAKCSSSSTGGSTTGAAAPSATATTPSSLGPDPNSPTAKFFVLNGTVHAASDHEVLGSSAFPNYASGAVDNYYSLAYSHVDNSPFSEATASPFDTGPVGQTAAAGNTQQPQYADARCPGDPNKASYGNQGGPYATAQAGDYNATAEASEASNGLAVPNGFDNQLRLALAAWKAKYAAALGLPKLPKVTVPAVTVPTPAATVTTPAVTVTTPSVPSLPTAPPVNVPTTAAPSVPVPSTPLPTRSVQAADASGDGESLLDSTTSVTLDPKAVALLTSGESSLARVSIGGGQIVLRGIHVSASITNDGAAPSYKADITLASASIAGIPVTIDKDGVHLAGTNQSLPYQQASDGLNSALKQAGVRIFLVAPEVSTCDQGGPATGSGTSTTTTTTSSSDQSGSGGATSSCDQSGTGMTCDQSGSGSGTTTSTDTTATPTPPTSTLPFGTSPTSSPCDQGTSTTCDQSSTGSGTGTTTNTTTTTSTTPLSSPSGGTTTTSTTPSSCDQTGMPPTTGSCSPKSTTTATTTTTTTSATTGDQSGTTAPPNPMDLPGSGSPGVEETVTATGVHIVFTQPVDQSGVPAQFAEHILGEVSLHSLAVPAGPLPNLNLSSPSALSSPTSATTGTASCGKTGGGHALRTTKSGGGLTTGGSSSAGGSSASSGGALGASSGLSPSAASSLGSSAQPTTGSTGSGVPAEFAAALRKPLWLLLAYLAWQALVIGTGASLWNWRREEAP